MNKALGQYYTVDNVSDLLVSQINAIKPEKVLDIGVGSGSLISAALRKWAHTKVVGVDIDKNNIEKIGSNIPQSTLICANGLAIDLSEHIEINKDSLDVAICNPPYLKLKKTKDTENILNEAKLGSNKDYNYLSTDLVFLAQNLCLLRLGGELGIIVPDGLVTSHTFQAFRKNLLKNHTLKCIIELPSSVFKKTEAKTHILIIEKGKSRSSRVMLYKSSLEGKIIDKISAKKDMLIQRMDFDFHDIGKQLEYYSKNLTDFDCRIHRGVLSKKVLTQSNVAFIHSTDFERDFNIFSFDENVHNVNTKIATKGDFIISRVGKRCLGKVGYVESGSIPVSDCVFIIKSREENKDMLKQLFESLYWKKWVNAYGHGVCARVISKRDLESYPFFP